MRTLLAIFAFFTGAAVGTEAGSTELLDVHRMEAIWRSSGITTYSFQPQVHSAFPTRAPIVRVYVVNSKVKDIRLIAPFERYKVGSRISVSALKKRARYPLTVEDAFLRVRECIEYDRENASVEFHEGSGAPLHWICGEIAVDAWWGAELKDLELGAPPNSSLERCGNDKVLTSRPRAARAQLVR